MKLIRSELQFSDSFVCSKHQTVTELTDGTVDVLYEAETTHYTNARAQNAVKDIDHEHYQIVSCFMKVS